MNSNETITPLVSVALCTYNGAAYLREQLDTILRQTHKHLEVVVVDDASTDDTMQILKEYAGKDHRIQLYQNESNLGFNLNFQKAIGLCKGEWIAIADQDDIWHHQKLQIMLQQWDKRSVLLHCASKKFSSATPVNYSRKPLSRGFSGTDVQQLAAKNTVEGHNILFHRSLKEKALPFHVNLFYDWWLGVVAAVNGGVQWIDQVLVWRRIHEHNTFEVKIAPLLDEQNVWKRHLQAFINIPGIKPRDKDFINQCLELLNSSATYQQWHCFILQQRHVFFYYKKGIFAFLSKRKHSTKLARKLAASA